MAKQVHIVPHMHWDREWYFSAEESKILLINNMEEIMERLENDPDYPTYTLDGQTSVLEDYLTILNNIKNASDEKDITTIKNQYSNFKNIISSLQSVSTSL